MDSKNPGLGTLDRYRPWTVQILDRYEPWTVQALDRLIYKTLEKNVFKILKKTLNFRKKFFKNFILHSTSIMEAAMKSNTFTASTDILARVYARTHDSDLA